MKRTILSIFLFVSYLSSAQTKITYPIAFYNTENLFDTQNDPNTDDDQFTPQGSKNWTQDKYQKKLNHIASVINQLGRDKSTLGAVILGLAEVENDAVLKNLIACKAISAKGYKYVHYDSPDKRGIDVALLYNPLYFKVTSSKAIPVSINEDPSIRTRDILLVTGNLMGESLTLILNHWSSRLHQSAAAYREEEALICKQLYNTIQQSNPKTKIIIMGDMNDTPQDKSCRRVLGAKKDPSKDNLYNPMWALSEKGLGTICYKQKWYLFDQIIVSPNLLDNKTGLNFEEVEIFKKNYLLNDKGIHKGEPLPSFLGNKFVNGYSDHLPILAYLTK